jgi:hypothetical protein
LAQNEKLEEDFKNFNLKIERLAQAEIEKIRQETNTLKEEARKIGSDVERQLQ